MLFIFPLLVSLFFGSTGYGIVVDSCKVGSISKNPSLFYRTPKGGSKDALWQVLRDYKPKKNRKFLVIIPSYNNKDWYKKNLDSVFMQNYPFYKVIYVDDCSTDGTGELVEKYVKEKKQEDHFVIIKNKERMFALANIYVSIYAYGAADDIVVVLDGDDWWAHNHVLTMFNSVYDKFDVWMTYGQYKTYPAGKIGCSQRVPDYVIENNSFRNYKWVTSQQRTFYVWLFKLIKQKDLLYEGKFFKCSGDVGVMLPMLEMSGYRSMFIPDVIYIYNRANVLNNNKLRPGVSLRPFIRKKERYKRLKARPT